MMKDLLNNIRFGLIAWLAIIFIGGILLGRNARHLKYEKALKEQEILRKNLEVEKRNVIEYRRGMAEERRVFSQEINKSNLRYDSLERIMKIRESVYIKDIMRLKGRSLKQLEDEAERIYREHANNPN